MFFKYEENFVDTCLILWILLGTSFDKRMIYTAIDTFYLTDEQLNDSPSRKDGIDEATETTLRIYGCDLIQESGILLRLYVIFAWLFYNRIFRVNLNFFLLTDLVAYRPQAVMATGQVLFHRFYCKKSFARFNVKVGWFVHPLPLKPSLSLQLHVSDVKKPW